MIIINNQLSWQRNNQRVWRETGWWGIQAIHRRNFQLNHSHYDGPLRWSTLYGLQDSFFIIHELTYNPITDPNGNHVLIRILAPYSVDPLWFWIPLHFAWRTTASVTVRVFDVCAIWKWTHVKIDCKMSSACKRCSNIIIGVCAILVLTRLINAGNGAVEMTPLVWRVGVYTQQPLKVITTWRLHSRPVKDDDKHVNRRLASWTGWKGTTPTDESIR